MFSKIFDIVQNFWLDWWPWSLRYRLKCMREENRSLCTDLQQTQWELLETKRVLREAMKKMHLPIRGHYPLPDAHSSIENEHYPLSSFWLNFDRYVCRFSLDKYAFPRYSAALLDYLAHESAHQLVSHMEEHVYKEVKKFYEKEFLPIKNK